MTTDVALFTGYPTQTTDSSCPPDQRLLAILAPGLIACVWFCSALRGSCHGVTYVADSRECVVCSNGSRSAVTVAEGDHSHPEAVYYEKDPSFCANEWISHNGSSYILVNGGVDWYEAFNLCYDLNAIVVEMETEQEQMLLNDIFRTCRGRYWSSATDYKLFGWMWYANDTRAEMLAELWADGRAPSHNPDHHSDDHSCMLP